MKILYTNHAAKQMFYRSISTEEAESVLEKGEIIANYPDDKPYPSRLMLAFSNERPIHIVCSFNLNENTTVIITAYSPSLDIWEDNFKIRKK